MRRTKIVCTIGPATNSRDGIRMLIEAGMDVARLNFSHGTREEQGQNIDIIREVSQELGVEIPIILDTQGPEIRIGTFKNGKVNLKQGQRFTLTTRKVEGTAEEVFVNYATVIGDVGPGHKIYLDDGLLVLEVKEVSDTDVICEVIVGGELSDRKKVNLPGTRVSLPALTDKDKQDIRFGIDKGVDFIAASFVRKAEDILAIRHLLEEYEGPGDPDAYIIAKIENEEGYKNLYDILRVVDGLMVARGDLGVELPAEEVPLIQKEMIRACNKVGKVVITATQMLDSMIRNPRPTRAEATDIANAIFDGTDAVMLSGETAAGKYPELAVKTMARIAERTDRTLNEEWFLRRQEESGQSASMTHAISRGTCEIASKLGVRAIITSTKSGHTARMVAKFRPRADIIGVTPNARVLRKLSLVWGVRPLLGPDTRNTDEMMDAVVEEALDHGYIEMGDLVVLTAGVPAGIPGTTNLIKVHVVGDILVRGTGVGNRPVAGPVRIAADAGSAVSETRRGEILVVKSTTAEYMPAIRRAAGIVTEEGGLTSHAAITGLNLGIPVIVGARDALSRLDTGMVVTLDTARGVVYRGETKVS